MINKIKFLEKEYLVVRSIIKNELNILPLENKQTGIIKNICEKSNLEEKLFIGGCEVSYYQNLGDNSFVFVVGNLNPAKKTNEHAEIGKFNSYFCKFYNIITFLKDNKS